MLIDLSKVFDTINHDLLTAKKSLITKNVEGVVLIDLSKVFDTINHDLLTAKFHVYGFNNDSLKLLNSYLNNI